MVALAAAIFYWDISSTYFKRIICCVIWLWPLKWGVTQKGYIYGSRLAPNNPYPMFLGDGGKTPNFVKTYFRLPQHVLLRVFDISEPFKSKKGGVIANYGPPFISRC